MSTTGSPLNITEMAAGELYPHSTFNAAMAILNRTARVDEALANEVSVTGAATLSATAFGKTHIISGTAGNYTVTLFTPATADLGKIIGFRVADSATKVFVLDANSTETIDGQLTFSLGRNDIIYLKAIATSGNTWQIVGYKMAKASARVFHSANQSINTAASTALAFNSERWDTDTIHDTSTNNSRLTCKTPGKYLIEGHAGFAANATGWRAASFLVTGTTSITAERALNVGGTDAIYLVISSVWDLVVGDYVEFMVEHNAGIAINVLASASFSPEFTMQRIG